MRPSVLWLSLVLLALAPRSAMAFTFTDDAGDLRAPLDPATGERLCIAIPTGHVDPDACAGYNTAALGKTAFGRDGTSVVAVAMLRSPSSQVLFMTLRAAESKALTEDTAGEVAAGMERGEKEMLPESIPTIRNEHHFATIAGRQALVVDVDLNVPAASPLHPLFGHAHYVQLRARDSAYTFTFTGGLDSAAATNAVADRVLQKLTLAKEPDAPSSASDDVRSDGHDGTPAHRDPDDAFRSGERVGRLIGLLIIPALIVVGIVFALRRKPTPPPYGYPLGHQGWQPPPQGYPPQGQHGWQQPPPGYSPYQNGPPAAWNQQGQPPAQAPMANPPTPGDPTQGPPPGTWNPPTGSG